MPPGADQLPGRCSSMPTIGSDQDQSICGSNRNQTAQVQQTRRVPYAYQKSFVVGLQNIEQPRTARIIRSLPTAAQVTDSE